MIYVTSDLHGYPLGKFKALLSKANFSERDFCMVLGDVIDRGPDGIRLLEWMMLQPNVDMILGNHEAFLLACDFLFDAVTQERIDSLTTEKMDVLSDWLQNGGDVTLKALRETDPAQVEAIMEYLREAPLYETVSAGGREFLLVHSGLENFDKDKPLGAYTADELLWCRPSWDDRYFDEIITVFGHTPTGLFGREYADRMVQTDTWIDIDTGASSGRRPMLLRLDDLTPIYADV